MVSCETTDVGPVSVCVLDLQEALELVTGMIDAPDSSVVAFCNAHTVNLARDDPRFARALQGAVVLNDGVGLDLARWLLQGARFPANLNGTDFTPAVLAAVPRPLKVFLLGSPPGVAKRAAEVLATRFAHHAIVGVRDGFFESTDGACVAQEIAATGANLVLVGMGQPRQELWAAEHGGTTGAVVMCVGAYLDFAAGVVSRAPDMIRVVRGEWLYRLALEPRRLGKRYLLGNPRFIYGIIRDRLGRVETK